MGTASGFSDYSETQLLNHYFRSATFSKPSNIYVGLHIGDPYESGTGGPEVSGGSYARAQLNPDDANWALHEDPYEVYGLDEDPYEGQYVTNLVTLTYPAPTADWGTVTWMAIYDALTTGNMLFLGPLDVARTILNGDPIPVFPVGSLIIRLI